MRPKKTLDKPVQTIIEGCTFYSGAGVVAETKAVEALAAAAKANAEAISAIAKMVTNPDGGSVGLQFVSSNGHE